MGSGSTGGADARGRTLTAAASLLVAAAAGCGSERVVLVPAPSPERAAATAATAKAPLQVATEPEPAPTVPPPPLAASRGCELDRLVPAGCERLRGVSASGTGREPAAAQAFDGDACTIWNAGGFPPQSATLDLGAVQAVTRVVLVPEMTPESGMATETVELSDDGRTFRRLGELHTSIRSGEPIELPIPGSVKARFVRVATTALPSWVAWRDILVLRCAGR